MPFLVTLKAVLLWGIICDGACENQPCKHALHKDIFSLISLVLNAVSCFCKLQKKAH